MLPAALSSTIARVKSTRVVQLLSSSLSLTGALFVFFCVTPFLVLLDVVIFGLYSLPMGTLKYILSYGPKYLDISMFYELAKLIYQFVAVAVLIGIAAGISNAIVMFIVHLVVRFDEISFTLPLLGVPITILGSPEKPKVVNSKTDETIKRKFDMDPAEFKKMLLKEMENPSGQTKTGEFVRAEREKKKIVAPAEPVGTTTPDATESADERQESEAESSTTDSDSYADMETAVSSREGSVTPTESLAPTPGELTMRTDTSVGTDDN